MTTIQQAREGLAAAVTNGTGLRALAYESDTVNAPCAWVLRREMDPRLVLGGTKQQYNLTVRLFMPRTAERSNLLQIDEFCAMSGDKSIRSAVEDGDNWTDGLVDYVSVVSVGPTNEAALDSGERFLTVDFDVEVVW